MAQIHEEVIVIKLSKLVKSGTVAASDLAGIATEEILSALEQVVQELVGDSVIVEVEAA
jgi:hypothetical protein